MTLVQRVISLFIGLFVIAIFAVSLRGNWGAPNSIEIGASNWTKDGPFESSNERGRFALTYSVVEDNSVAFSLPLARFSTPDVAQANGKFVSLFAPGLSYLIIPAYMLGREHELSQVASYAVIALFAVFNFLLIRALVKHFGGSFLAGNIAALLFVFGSPGFAYGVSFYQHHVSTFAILASLYILARFKNVWTLGLVWFLCVASLTVDYPNFFLMLPIGLYALTRIVFVKQEKDDRYINFKYLGLLTFVTMVPVIYFFMQFNSASYGNPFQLSGTVQSAVVITEEGKVDVSEGAKRNNAQGSETKNDKTAIGFFDTRDLPNGLYTHILSYDRGMILYTPVMFLGILGLVALYKKNKTMTVLISTIVCLNLLVYSMWGDPYGGWSFGSRYMVPAYALLSVAIGMAITEWRRSWWFLLLLIPLAWYSITINTIGAVTSNENPPKSEVLALESLTNQRERYTFTRNMEMLNQNRSKSFAYNTWFSNNVNAWQFVTILATSINGVLTISLLALILAKSKKV